MGKKVESTNGSNAATLQKILWPAVLNDCTKRSLEPNSVLMISPLSKGVTGSRRLASPNATATVARVSINPRFFRLSKLTKAKGLAPKKRQSKKPVNKFIAGPAKTTKVLWNRVRCPLLVSVSPMNGGYLKLTDG